MRGRHTRRAEWETEGVFVSLAFLTKPYVVKTSKMCSSLCSGASFCASCTAWLIPWFCDGKHCSNVISCCCFVSEEINQLLRIRLFALMRNSIQ